MKNRICELFSIEKPIIQAGMVWVSGWRLAAAVSNAGGLGIIGAGSMSPEILEEHIQKFQKASNKPFAVNLPLLYPRIEEQISVIEANKVPIVFTSAGNPSLYTERLKKAGLLVVHVVSSAKFAKKAEAAGVDAIVAEGFEAGGHNGREETTTLCLIPMIKAAISLPLIAAGGIASGEAMLAAMALGADAVQIGSRFAVTEESSAHINYKQRIVESQEGETVLTLKALQPVRLIKNAFYEDVLKAEKAKATLEELAALLGKGRAKKGIFEGDLNNGEIEIGQIAATIQDIPKAAYVVESIWESFLEAKIRAAKL